MLRPPPPYDCGGGAQKLYIKIDKKEKNYTNLLGLAPKKMTKGILEKYWNEWQNCVYKKLI